LAVWGLLKLTIKPTSDMPLKSCAFMPTGIYQVVD
jgi:hypothetical protein